jgi:hypothetical protein
LIPYGEWKYAQIPEKRSIVENSSNAPSDPLSSVTDVIRNPPGAI